MVVLRAPSRHRCEAVAGRQQFRVTAARMVPFLVLVILAPLVERVWSERVAVGSGALGWMTALVTGGRRGIEWAITDALRQPGVQNRLRVRSRRPCRTPSSW